MAQFPSSSPNAIIFGTGQRIGKQTNGREVITLPARDLLHVHCLGKSSYGKSRWLASLFVMLLNRGITAWLIDPAGDLARLCRDQLIALGYFDHHPTPFDKLLYLDLPAAQKQNLYLPFNVLNVGHDPYTTADMVLEACKRAWPSLKSGSSTTIETLVKVSSFVLASVQLPLFPFMYTLLTDAAFRHSLLARITDSLVLQFFEQHTHPRTGELSLGTDPTLKRLFLITFAPLLRYSLGQQDNLLNFRTLLDTKTSLIINLNVPDLEAMRFLGSLLTVHAEMGAKGRGEIPAETRQGACMLIIDEFQNFTAQSGEALSTILDQCRKFGLFLCLANQGFSQLPSGVEGALHNCDIRAVFRLEEPDAKAAAPLLGFPIDKTMVKYSATGTPSYVSASEQKEHHMQAITNLDKREAFLKLPGDRLYHMRSLTVPDPVVSPRKQAEIEQAYFRRFFKKQSEIEQTIAQDLARAAYPATSLHVPDAADEPLSIETVPAVPVARRERL